jgi:1,4-dihydroxy-2-naphthoate octaprenyltransferase
MNLFGKGISGLVAGVLMVKAFLLVQTASQSPSYIFPALPVFLVGIAISLLLVATGRIVLPTKSHKEKSGR